QIDGSTIEQHPKPLVATVWIVVINPSIRGFSMWSGERRPCDHAVTSAPLPGDEKRSLDWAPIVRASRKRPVSTREALE
ncbi:hypothetical protein, partial [Nonomuraea sp. NPDC003754]